MQTKLPTPQLPVLVVSVPAFALGYGIIPPATPVPGISELALPPISLLQKFTAPAKRDSEAERHANFVAMVALKRQQIAATRVAMLGTFTWCREPGCGFCQANGMF